MLNLRQSRSFSPLSFSQPATLPPTSSMPPSTRLPVSSSLSSHTSLSSSSSLSSRASLSASLPLGSSTACPSSSPPSKDGGSLPSLASASSFAFSGSLCRTGEGALERGRSLLPSLVFSETSRNATSRVSRHEEQTASAAALKRKNEEKSFFPPKKRERKTSEVSVGNAGALERRHSESHDTPGWDLTTSRAGVGVSSLSSLSRSLARPVLYPSLDFSPGMSTREIVRRQQKALCFFLRSIDRARTPTRRASPPKVETEAKSRNHAGRTSDASTACSSSYSASTSTHPSSLTSSCASPSRSLYLEARDVTFTLEQRRDKSVTPATALPPALATRRAKIVDLVLDWASQLQASGALSVPDDICRSSIQLAVSLLDRSNLVAIFEDCEEGGREKTLEQPTLEEVGESDTRGASEKHEEACVPAGSDSVETTEKGPLHGAAPSSEEARICGQKRTATGAHKSLSSSFPRPRVSGDDPQALKTIAALCLCTALQFDAPNAMAFERKAKKLFALSHLCCHTFEQPFPEVQRAFLDRVACVVSVPVPIDFANYFLYKFDSAYIRRKANSSAAQLVAFLLDCFALTPQAVCTPGALAGAAAVLLARRICDNKRGGGREREEAMWTTEMKNVTGFDASQVKKVLKIMNAFLTSKRGRFSGLHKLHTRGWAAVEWERPKTRKSEKEERKKKDPEKR
ncbi:UNVERIFIED_CONTAM: hypothetical protein HHA_229200 [Hammondia hammondi]|eukprot:XP_008889513.1 hypothetical protein HHA_229200 [Hammondia hammondi]